MGRLNKSLARSRDYCLASIKSANYCLDWILCRVGNVVQNRRIKDAPGIAESETEAQGIERSNERCANCCNKAQQLDCIRAQLVSECGHRCAGNYPDGNEESAYDHVPIGGRIPGFEASSDFWGQWHANLLEAMRIDTVLLSSDFSFVTRGSA